ncbi:hypothetical protein PMAYCL1PPCAC_03949 [Pristionchus mayeri]|uniref:C2H2-type domain-containing protein n=1 Tax=Pristionchus mayeri TaxID=1317129 RepID=A0AAN5C9E5_9BILA|nr:hypothetical protein PMAYCL1PPCAC_03949 [Pristionchus mayeri]
MEELMKQKNNKKNLSSPRTAPTQSSIGRPPRQASPIRKTQSTKKTPSPRKASATRQASTTRRTPSSDGSSDEERSARPSSRQKAAAKQRETVVARSKADNKQKSVQQQRMNVADADSEKDDQLIELLTRKSNAFTSCAQCKELVKCNLVDRQTHVKQKHMADVPLHVIQDNINLVEERTTLAFPGMIYSRWQCVICPTAFIQSEGGRMSHVATTHFTTNVFCTMVGCTFSSVCPSDMKGHYEKTHGMNYKKDLHSSEQNVAVCDQRNYAEAQEESRWR